MGNFIYYETLEDYEEQVKKAKLCDEKDKEIERLNEELKQAKEIALNEHKYASEMEDKYVEVNNIINELEKWLEEKIDEYKDMELHDNASMFEYTLYEIKELKGSDKE